MRAQTRDMNSVNYYKHTRILTHTHTHAHIMLRRATRRHSAGGVARMPQLVHAVHAARAGIFLSNNSAFTSVYASV